MSLLQALLGESNPAAQWAGKNQNWLGTVGTGIANGLEFGNLGEARQMDYLGEQQKIAEAKVTAQTSASHGWLRQYFPDLADQVDAGAPIGEIMPLAFDRMKPQATEQSAFDERFSAGQQYGLTGDDLNTFALTGSVPGTSRANVTYGTTPVWGQDSATGKTGYGVTGSDGSFKLVDTGGFQPMGPGDVALDRAQGTTLGKAGGQAVVDLPAAVQQGEYAVQQLKGLLPNVADPTTGRIIENAGFNDQFGTFLGVPTQQMLPALPNTPKADFQERLKQVQGGAFLQAFESLKGGGAISEVEGLKAQQAIMRASTSQTPGEFEKAINEAITIYELGIQRAKDMARLGPQGAANQVLNGAGGNRTSTGVTYTVEP